MSDLIPKIHQSVGEIIGEVKGINQRLDRMNGKLAEAHHTAIENASEIKVIKTKAAIFGAIAGVGGTLVLELVLRVLFNGD
jgi:hypothetical protein